MTLYCLQTFSGVLRCEMRGWECCVGGRQQAHGCRQVHLARVRGSRLHLVRLLKAQNVRCCVFVSVHDSSSSSLMCEMMRSQPACMHAWSRHTASCITLHALCCTALHCAVL